MSMKLYMTQFTLPMVAKYHLQTHQVLDYQFLSGFALKIIYQHNKSILEVPCKVYFKWRGE